MEPQLQNECARGLNAEIALLWEVKVSALKVESFGLSLICSGELLEK